MKYKSNKPYSVVYQENEKEYSSLNYGPLVNKVAETLRKAKEYNLEPEVIASTLINVSCFACYRKDFNGLCSAMEEACAEWDVK